jgi:hypothetical protein
MLGHVTVQHVQPGKNPAAMWTNPPDAGSNLIRNVAD